jgi:uncharacterized protein (DUF1810 family)
LDQTVDDPYNLERFVEEQQRVIASVLSDLKQGRKRGHWMWFIFPQLRELGRSETSKFYGIASLQEAVAYLRHALLGPRLVNCTELVNAVNGSSAEDIFRDIDAMKFRSSMTLFAHAAPDNKVFIMALGKYFDGEFDPLTIDYLRRQKSI